METPYTVCAAVLAVVGEAFDLCGFPMAVAATEDEPAVDGIIGMVSVGGIVVDDCCGGLLIVAPERVYRAKRPFPTAADADENCADGLLAVDLMIYMARCIPVLDDQGNAPSLASQAEAYGQVLADAAIVWGAAVGLELLGQDQVGDPLWERANVVQIFTPAQGGCTGSETRLTVGLPFESWCPPCVPPD